MKGIETLSRNLLWWLGSCRSETPSRLKGIETYRRLLEGHHARCSETPSRLKGIETFFHRVITSNFSSSETPSRLKGIETVPKKVNYYKEVICSETPSRLKGIETLTKAT